MRPLPLVVLSESVLLALLLAIWLGRGEGIAAPPSSAEAARRDQATSGDSARAPTAERDSAGSGVADAATARREVATTPSASILLHGRLLPDDGSAPPDDANVWLRAIGGDGRSGTVFGGAYAIAGLRPGAWELSIRTDDFASVRLPVTIGPEPVQTLDIELVRSHRIAVLLRTPDDRPLLEALAKEHGRTLAWAMSVIATAQPLREDLPMTDNTLVGDVGIGRFHAEWNNHRNGTGVPKDADGMLLLDGPPPANAALLLRHVVVQQQPVGAGQNRIVFVVDPDALLARTGTVRLRVVDPAGAPIAGAQVQLGTAQGGRASARTGDDGCATLQNVLPGIGLLDLTAKDRETRRQELRVAGECDLGDVVLAPAAEIRGRLVDADGAAVRGRVCWTDLDAMAQPCPLVTNFHSLTERDGTFALHGAGPRRFVVLGSSDADGRLGHATVDARSGAAEVTLVVRTPGAIEVAARGEPLAGYVARLLDGDGTPIDARRLEPRWPEQTLRAPRGDYTLEVFDGHDRQVLRRPVTLGDEPLRVEVR
ncbi:MAG: carboxypeptidase regulatory-like domain-containing protein [Planctomycetota bacterium]